MKKEKEKILISIQISLVYYKMASPNKLLILGCMNLCASASTSLWGMELTENFKQIFLIKNDLGNFHEDFTLVFPFLDEN